MQLIDRHALLKNVYDNPPEKARMAQGEWCRKCIYEAPTIEAEPVRHGRWVETEPDEDDRKIGIEFSIKCSLCHNENSHLDFNEDHEITGKTFWKSRFCPNCGARMDATEPPEKE